MNERCVTPVMQHSGVQFGHGQCTGARLGRVQRRAAVHHLGNIEKVQVQQRSQHVQVRQREGQHMAVPRDAQAPQ